MPNTLNLLWENWEPVTLTSDFHLLQIPAGCGWSGSWRHPGGIRGHGTRWGAHCPHPSLWYTPLPGPVAKPALQTRRDQRAPHRAIAAEGIQMVTSLPDSSTLRTNQSQINRSTGTKRQWNNTSGCLLNESATGNRRSVPGNLYFYHFSFYSVSLGSVPTLLFDDVFFFGCCFSSGHAYDCGRRVQCF